MDGADTLLAGLASGDRASADVLVPEPAMKRDQDSMDDFEHLDREGKKEEVGESPLHMPQSTTRNATQSFLDMERDEFLDTPRAPSVTEKSDHLADKFTDSESDAGESPLHRPVPPATHARDPTPEPSAPMDPTPALIPAPAQKAPEPVPEPTPALKTEIVAAPTISEPKEEAKPVTKEIKDPEPAPALPPAAAPKPEPIPEKKEPVAEKKEPAPAKAPAESKPEPTRGPTAHVIEAEVIFCQMGLVSAAKAAYTIMSLELDVGKNSGNDDYDDTAEFHLAKACRWTLVGLRVEPCDVVMNVVLILAVQKRSPLTSGESLVVSSRPPHAYECLVL
ncbi:unnamed protein product [Colias eurytheme]|nr:unnamed protein product [Colias eurytheme]